MSTIPSLKLFKRYIHDAAVVSPVLAGVIAPLSVLYDIPALTEKWYSKNGTPAPDPKASLVLSGVSLAFSVIANGLLLMRFSFNDEYRRIHQLIPLSVACWLVKAAVTLTNLIVFGILTRNEPSYSYLEGFWCSVLSLVTAFLVLVFLILQLVTEWRHQRASYKHSANHEAKKTVRVSGRHFMLQTTLFLGIVALTAFIFSRIENWTYLEGIYFSIVTFLTVGFGDKEPTHTSTRIILFPLAILGITVLGTQIDMIVTFFEDRSERRKAKAQAQFESERRQAARERIHTDKGKSGETQRVSLYEEIEFLERLHSRQNIQDQLSESLTSLAGFVTFWLVGAAIFSSLESWSYGTGLYFSYIFFLTIGYGDYAPQSPAGRVVFISYSLLAVPILASFAVQAVTQGWKRISSWRLDNRRAEVGAKTVMSDAVVPHVRLLEDVHKKWLGRQENQYSTNRRSKSSTSLEQDTTMGKMQSEVGDETSSALTKAVQQGHDEGATKSLGEDSPGTISSKGQATKEEQHINKEAEKFAREVVERAIELEQRARRMMVRALPNGSRAQILLRADRAVQAQDVHTLTSAGAFFGSEEHEKEVNSKDGDGKAPEDDMELLARLGLGEEEDFTSLQALDDDEAVEEIEKYRACLAALLYAGGRLMKLEGVQAALLERRPYPHPVRDHNT